MNAEPNDIEVFTVIEAEVGIRLDKVVTARFSTISRSLVQELIETGEILVNDRVRKSSYAVELDDRITVALPPVVNLEVEPDNDVDFDVIYEDEHIAVIEKPAGLVVHPAVGNLNKTLVNGLLAKYPQIKTVGDDMSRAGLVHRLDKDTSGVMVIALTEPAREQLITQFKDRVVEKHYITLTEKHPTHEVGRVEAPIGRDPSNRKRMAVVKDGREAITEFRVRERYSDNTFMDVYIFTGRTHQIRVHLAFIGCPVVGDQVYGYRKQRLDLDRLFLHAFRIAFNHPMSGERMAFEVPLPTELEAILETLYK